MRSIQEDLQGDKSKEETQKKEGPSIYINEGQVDIQRKESQGPLYREKGLYRPRKNEGVVVFIYTYIGNSPSAHSLYIQVISVI